jgi:hypothetical protein
MRSPAYTTRLHGSDCDYSQCQCAASLGLCDVAERYGRRWGEFGRIITAALACWIWLCGRNNRAGALFTRHLRRLLRRCGRTARLWDANDMATFNHQWHAWLNRGDPYYNRYLTLDLVDMGLDLSLPHYFNSPILNRFL